jgi:diguanylate cyclase (GGDEF)-like protein/PAS domain S-box-containing protein
VKPDEKFYQELLDNLDEGVYFVDRDRKITYWNRGAQGISGYASAEVVGKRCKDSILVHVDEKGKSLCEEGCPLAETIDTGQVCEATVYLLHKDGHRIPVSIRAAPIRDNQGNIIGAVESFRDRSNLEAVSQRLQELEKMALLDSLTGLSNRRHIEASMQIRLEELARYGWAFGLLFIDIDDFKAINDTHGHEVGDSVLKLVSMTLLNSLRPFDILGRWGGEEFVAVVVNVNKIQLLQIAERALTLVGHSSLFAQSGAIRVTVSIGATMAEAGESVPELLERADVLMYQSKKSGKNQVTME